MKESIRIIPLSEREAWQEEHLRGGRPAQAWSYAMALSARDRPISLAVVSADGARLLVPFFEREWQGSTDIATPLGLSGASVDRPSLAPWELWREFATSQGWVAGYVQLAHDVERVPGNAGDGVAVGQTVFVLDLSLGDPLPRASEIIRRKVRRAERTGVALVSDPALLAPALARLYPSTMARLGASAVYLHDEETLHALAMMPGAVVVGARLDGKLEAVSVFSRSGARAEFVCNACSEAGRDFSAWLIASAAGMLRAQGVLELDLGGGASPGDGLFEFKARFNGMQRQLRSLRQVYDPSRYAELCRSSGVDPSHGWFPAYRAPRNLDA